MLPGTIHYAYCIILVVFTCQVTVTICHLQNKRGVTVDLYVNAKKCVLKEFIFIRVMNASYNNLYKIIMLRSTHNIMFEQKR